MSFGSVRPSPSPSAAYRRHVEGSSCKGPTARSQTESPSSWPWSESGTLDRPGEPSSRGPRICPRVRPAASTWPSRALPDSARPIAASSGQCSWQTDWVTPSTCSACGYAASGTPGMPLGPDGTLAGLADTSAGGSVKLSSPADDPPVADSPGRGSGIAVSEIDPGSGGAPRAPDVASDLASAVDGWSAGTTGPAGAGSPARATTATAPTASATTSSSQATGRTPPPPNGTA